MKKCKCKIKDHYIIIYDKGIKCCKCNKWIGKVRSIFYKNIIIKYNDKIYDRNKEKKRTRKQKKEE